MQHFFFNLRSDGVLIKDYTGTTLGDLDEATFQATEMAAHMREFEKYGANIDGRQIEICNEIGLIVQVVSVRQLSGVEDAR